MARLTAVGLVRKLTPPWLQRTEGAAVMEGIAQVLDEFVHDRIVQGVKLRFPGAPPRALDEKALALIGRERRVRRGPGEDAATYAPRLRGWWDAHRTRGGPYALLEQLYAFFVGWLNVRMDVVYYSGTRRWIDASGTITHDSISWSASGPEEGGQVALVANVLAGDTEIRPLSLVSFPAVGPYQVRLRDGFGAHEVVTASGTSAAPYDRIVLSAPVVGAYAAGSGTVARANVRWAHVWVFVHCPATIPRATSDLITSDGDTLITSDGDTLVATDTIALDELLATDPEAEIFRAIPREWSAAHIPYVTVVLLYGAARLWGYPTPVPTWGTWGTWQSDDPVVLIAE